MGPYREGSQQTSYIDIVWEITRIIPWYGKFLTYAGVSHDADYFPYQMADKIRRFEAE